MTAASLFRLLWLWALLLPGLGLTAETTANISADHKADPAGVSLSPAEQDFVRAQPPLRILIVDRPPFEYFKDGQASGFTVEFLRLLLRKLGLTNITYVPATFAQGLQMLGDGHLDIVPDIARTPEREQLMLFTEPYRYATKAIVARSGAAFPDISSLDGRRIAVESRNISDKIIRDSGIAATRVECAAVAECLLFVSQGKADAYIETTAVVEYQIAARAIADLAVVGSIDNAQTPSRFALRKDASMLAALINRAIASTSVEERASLAERWMSKGAVDLLFGRAVSHIALNAQERQYLLEKQNTLRVCSAPAGAPLSEVTSDGTHVGIAPDIVSRLAQTMGVRLDFVASRSWSETLEDAKARRCDLISFAQETPERRAYLDFTTPYADFPIVIVTRSAQPYFNDIGPHLHERFGVIRAFGAVPAIKARVPGITIREYADAGEGLRAVQKGEIFGFIGTLPIANRHLLMEGMTDLRVASQLTERMAMQIAVRNDDPYLTSLFQRAINALPPEKRQEIILHWTAVRYEKAVDTVLLAKWVGGVVAAATLLLLLVLAWNRHLARLNRELDLKVAERTRELVGAKQMAEAGARSKAEFLANMSHEIRTPLNAIMGLSQLVRVGGLTPEQDRRMVQLEQASTHLMATIGAVLDLSKIESGKFTLHEEPLSIETVVENVIAMVEYDANAKNLRLGHEIAPLPAGLVGDHTRLQQALLNYVVNAVKFTESGTINVRVEVLEDGPGDARLRFSVTDSGIGIAPDRMARLFTAFEQVDNGITRRHGGTGLGLSITKHFAALMGGDAGADSTPGQGSTFWFTARLRKDSGAIIVPDLRAATTLSVGPPRERGTSRVLLVDDDPVNREIGAATLTRAGLTVDCAANGIEAVAMAAEIDYALILMDVHMPGMDGLEATRQIRRLARGADVPIVAVTASAFADDELRCRQAGMNDFIGKPAPPQHVQAMLSRWLDSPRPS